MLTLKAPAKNEEVSKWEDQLTEMAVGYEIVIDEKIARPEIKHCREYYEGEEAISKYLVELAEFMKSWGNCSCEQ